MFQSRLLRWENSRDTLLGGRNRLVSRFRMAEKTPSTNTHTHTHTHTRRHVGAWKKGITSSHSGYFWGEEITNDFCFSSFVFLWGFWVFSIERIHLSHSNTHTYTDFVLQVQADSTTPRGSYEPDTMALCWPALGWVDAHQPFTRGPGDPALILCTHVDRFSDSTVQWQDFVSTSLS